MTGRALATTFLLGVLLSWAPQSVFAQPGLVVGSDTAGPGQTATITVNYLGGGNVNAIRADIFFNESIVTPNLSNCGRTLGGVPITCAVRVNEFSNDAVRIIGGAFGGAVIPSGSLGTISFTVNSGASPQTLGLPVGNQLYESCFVDKSAVPKGCSTVTPSGTVNGSITIQNPANTVPATSSGGTVSFTLCPNESDSQQLNFTETGGDQAGAVTCSLASGADFSITPASLVVPAGGSASITLSLDAPASGTAADTLSCTIDGSPGYTLDLEQQNLGMAANLTMPGVSKAEGNSGQTSFTFSPRLSSPANCQFTIPISVTGTNNNDFISSSTVLSFNGTTSPVPFTVQVLGDTTVELNEQFNVVLGSPSIGLVTVVDQSAAGIILNDDMTTLSIAAASVEEGNQGITEVEVTATLNGRVDVGFNVGYSTRDISATVDDGDYQPVSGTLIFDGNPGEKGAFSVLVNGDEASESSESFAIDFFVNAAGRAVQADPSSATVTILNDDGETRVRTLVPSTDRMSGDRAGTSVSSSGLLVVVGVPGADGGTGQVSIFDLVGGQPVFVADLPAPSGALEGFGQTVSLSGDLVAVGTGGVSGAKGFNPDALSAAIFRRAGQSLQMVASVKAGEAAGGGAVVLRDGLLLVGSPSQAAVNVFRFEQNQLAPFATLNGPGGKGAQAGFGSTLAFRGGKLAVGAPGGALTAGTVALFELIGSNLQSAGQVQSMASSPGDGFGAAVSISGDTLVVGAPAAANGAGDVELFLFPDSSVGSVASMGSLGAETPGLAPGDGFGSSADIEDDRIVAGAPGAAGGGAVFRYEGDVLVELLTAPAGTTDFGRSVSSSDGNIVVGAPATDENAGAALIALELVFASDFEAGE